MTQPVRVTERTKSGRLLRGYAVVILLLIAGLGFVTVAGFNAGHRADSKLSTRLRSAQADARALYSQAVSAGATPTITPQGVAPVSLIAGPPGARGPGLSAAQAQAAFRIVCATTPALCQQPVDLSKLVAAVRVCQASGQCPATVGASGSPGASGASGASGQAGASGQDQPPLSQDAIVAGFAAFCASQAATCQGPAGSAGTSGASGSTGPTGPAGASGADGKDGASGQPGAAGAPGANGKDGKDAPIIVGVDCTSLVPITFTYQFSDGTSLTFSCTVLPEPSSDYGSHS